MRSPGRTVSTKSSNANSETLCGVSPKKEHISETQSITPEKILLDYLQGSHQGSPEGVLAVCQQTYIYLQIP